MAAAAADVFPDLRHLEPNKENHGCVASIYIEAVGIGIQDWELSIDEAAGKDCVNRPKFRACYDLSMAKLTLQKALLGH